MKLTKMSLSGGQMCTYTFEQWHTESLSNSSYFSTVLVLRKSYLFLQVKCVLATENCIHRMDNSINNRSEYLHSFSLSKQEKIIILGDLLSEKQHTSQQGNLLLVPDAQR